MYPFLGATTQYTASGYKICNDQLVGSSDPNGEPLVIGEIPSPAGMIFVQNNDATNYVELSLDSGMTKIFAKLKAGEFAVWRPHTAGAIYARANTADCSCTVIALQTVTVDSVRYHSNGEYGSGTLKATLSLSVSIGGDTISTETYYLDTFASGAGSWDCSLCEHVLTAGYTDMAGYVTSAQTLMVNAIDIGAGTVELTLGSGGTDPVAKLIGDGDMCLFPMGASKNLYATGADYVVCALNLGKTA